MGNRILALILALGLFGWLGLMVMQWQFGVGRFATSPQKLLLQPGRRVIVGGGRAVLGLMANRSKEVTIELRCADAETRLDLERGDQSEEICGVRVRWLEAAPVSQPAAGSAAFEISWTD